MMICLLLQHKGILKDLMFNGHNNKWYGNDNKWQFKQTKNNNLV
jgi:hypothetical protein